MYRFQYIPVPVAKVSNMTVLDTARRRATRARLVEAGISEFGTRGIDATSVEQVCEAAGFTRGAFYSNFSSKDDLCIEIAQTVAEESSARIRDALATMPDEIPADSIVTAILDVAHLSPALHATEVELSLRAARVPEFGERLRATRAGLLPMYLEVAEQAAARAGVRFTVPVADALEILETLHYSPRQIGYNEESKRLITLASQAFVEPIGTGA